MKQCRYCKKFYPESYFAVALTTKDKVYRRHKCKFCYLDTKNVLKRKCRDWLRDYKAKHGCSICEIKDQRVLEFHHLDKREKDFSISYASYSRISLDRIRKEIKKCVILCANCHRITHWEESSWQ